VAKPEPSKITGYVMAGGASTRFGRDKSQVVLGGKTMLQRMCDLLVASVGEARIVAPNGRYSALAACVVPDRWPGEGPLGGIVTALLDAAAAEPPAGAALIVGCDMPFLTPDWLRYLAERAATSETDVLLPESPSGAEPLCACWKPSAARALEKVFLAGARKITDALRTVKTELLDERVWKRFDTTGRLFWNMNTAADYAEVCRVWNEERS